MLSGARSAPLRRRHSGMGIPASLRLTGLRLALAGAVPGPTVVAFAYVGATGTKTTLTRGGHVGWADDGDGDGDGDGNGNGNGNRDGDGNGNGNGNRDGDGAGRRR